MTDKKTALRYEGRFYFFMSAF